jgi:hypothetical protein
LNGILCIHLSVEPQVLASFYCVMVMSIFLRSATGMTLIDIQNISHGESHEWTVPAEDSVRKAREKRIGHMYQ